jgi:hypothetical protein
MPIIAKKIRRGSGNQLAWALGRGRRTGAAGERPVLNKHVSRDGSRGVEKVKKYSPRLRKHTLHAEKKK